MIMSSGQFWPLVNCRVANHWSSGRYSSIYYNKYRNLSGNTYVNIGYEDWRTDIVWWRG
jgi:hypothetical protein